MDGILAHDYFDARDDIAAYYADECKRQAVSVAFAMEHLVDMTLWIFREDRIETDPWQEIVGIDKLIRGDDSGKYVLMTGRTGERMVEPAFRVFAQLRDLERVVPTGFVMPRGPKSEHRERVFGRSVVNL